MSREHIVQVPLEQNGHQFWPRETVDVMAMPNCPPMLLAAQHACSYCGLRPRLEIGSDAVRAVGDPCTVPDGITTTIRLAVPSGKLIVTDDLRPVYDLADEVEDGLADYNTCLGQAQYIEAMAALGCAYGPVGNSCPSLYRMGDGSYLIANPPWDEELDDAVDFPDSIELANIVTDRWAYSIADFADWQARGGDPATLNWCDTVVDVQPGVYEFTHHSGERPFAPDDRPTVYATIRRVD